MSAPWTVSVTIVGADAVDSLNPVKGSKLFSGVGGLAIHPP